MEERDPGTPLYGIAVAAQLTGVAEATLRLFERHGLLEPFRSQGGTRRYSEEDIERLQRVVALRDEGVNIAGVRRILDLEDENSGLRDRLDAGDEEEDRERSAEGLVDDGGKTAEGSVGRVRA